MITTLKSISLRWILAGGIVLIWLMATIWLDLRPVGAQSQPTLIPTPSPLVLEGPTATIRPELVPNPGQTDGIILGATFLILIIVIGTWVYGRNRKT